MIRINLLPHREIRRKQQQTQFFIMLGVVAAIGAGVWFAVHTYLEDQFQNQVGRNNYLKKQTEQLDKQIAEIDKLKGEIELLKTRAQVVETLQGTRSEAVYLLDQLPRLLPDGVYLRSIKQTGDRVLITGYTQSQARVSTLMRSLEGSSHLEKPGLIEIKSVALGPGRRTNEFIMNIYIKRAAAPGKAAPGKKG